MGSKFSGASSRTLGKQVPGPPGGKFPGVWKASSQTPVKQVTGPPWELAFQTLETRTPGLFPGVHNASQNRVKTRINSTSQTPGNLGLGSNFQPPGTLPLGKFPGVWEASSQGYGKQVPRGLESKFPWGSGNLFHRGLGNLPPGGPGTSFTGVWEASSPDPGNSSPQTRGTRPIYRRAGTLSLQK